MKIRRALHDTSPKNINNTAAEPIYTSTPQFSIPTVSTTPSNFADGIGQSPNCFSDPLPASSIVTKQDRYCTEVSCGNDAATNTIDSAQCQILSSIIRGGAQQYFPMRANKRFCEGKYKSTHFFICINLFIANFFIYIY
jgi:hypothetical protein